MKDGKDNERRQARKNVAHGVRPWERRRIKKASPGGAKEYQAGATLKLGILSPLRGFPTFCALSPGTHAAGYNLAAACGGPPTFLSPLLFVFPGLRA